ncbi:hypothetical protein [Tropicibacter naphthalenivorans]|uniref:Uncharacterized protein n=1 Tax=Tropicibacter naphthalenivorans TaxID=441103 RepID=A0A0P1GP00_9RHOB|nr:hypothetical protein [Tropicibacter naphthalenivorans]CUH77004.1 hypothetical protein TRN7648_01240 [Tropicibacter naphthalenivorans]SMC61659.1 hypothetical protein SAMN04488093_102378 [Tropicibacter naphthalenivorans]
MTPLFQPPPEVVAFLFVKKFVYLEVLALLALLRVIGGRGIARWPALVTLVMAASGIFTTFAPALGLNQGPLYTNAARLMAGNGGMSALLVPSAVFLICSITPRARWRWIDVVHIVMLSGLIGLWWWVS